MRILLFTGKGGVGKTTVAAATAALAASRGGKTLVLSTDPAHSLGDALGVRLLAEPTELDTGLAALQVAPQAAFERSWGEIQRYLRSGLERAGVDPLRAEELTLLPGAEEVLALLAVRDQAASGLWDLIVVDCAPTGETLRLLALPGILQWYLEKVFPAHRRALRAARPLLSLSGPPGAAEGLLAAVARLHAELTEVQALLGATSTTVRLVFTPEAVVAAETRRTLTSLALYGYRVDALVANRVFPSGHTDPFLAGWAAAQSREIDAVRADVAPLPVLVSAYRPAEPVGLPALTALGEQLYGPAELASVTDLAELVEVRATGTAEERYELSLALPLARAEDLSVARSGDDLILTIGPHRRLLALPPVLRRCLVAGATLRDGRLSVGFEPDPAQWIRR